ncbi:MAG: diaminopimelate epimerase [Candidatus Kapabacteria bacterium]|nr:diaminopimelate epimerase [Candidatus Kapabacteria bacterium]
MTFTHMSGAGNTFLVADGRSAGNTLLQEMQIQNIIAEHLRRDGAAVEGVLILRSMMANTFEADYYNPDGSYGMMCGNGSRCIVRFAVDHGLETSEEISFRLNGAPYNAIVNNDDLISIVFPPPIEEKTYEAGELDGISQPVDYINVNSDHVVIMGLGVGTEIRPIALALRHHASFPRGVNVNLVDIRYDGVVEIATFERGVEGITGACGTGALSSAVVLWRKGLVGNNVTFIPPSGRSLSVHISHDGATITNLTLLGDARYDDA